MTSLDATCSRTRARGRPPGRCLSRCRGAAGELGLIGLGVPRSGGRRRRRRGRSWCGCRGAALRRRGRRCVRLAVHRPASRCRTWSPPAHPDAARPLGAPDAAGRAHRRRWPITEPDGGSDVAGHPHHRRARRRRLRRERRQDLHHLRGAGRLRRRRRCAPAAPARTALSLLVVEKGTPGFTVSRPLDKMGWLCSDTAELSFADVRVPAAQPRRRREDTGFVQIAQHFVAERIGLAVQAYASRPARASTSPSSGAATARRSAAR